MHVSVRRGKGWGPGGGGRAGGRIMDFPTENVQVVCSSLQRSCFLTVLSYHLRALISLLK